MTCNSLQGSDGMVHSVAATPIPIVWLDFDPLSISKILPLFHHMPSPEMRLISAGLIPVCSVSEVAHLCGCSWSFTVSTPPGSVIFSRHHCLWSYSLTMVFERSFSLVNDVDFRPCILTLKYLSFAPPYSQCRVAQLSVCVSASNYLGTPPSFGSPDSTTPGPIFLTRFARSMKHDLLYRQILTPGHTLLYQASLSPYMAWSKVSQLYYPHLSLSLSTASTFGLQSHTDFPALACQIELLLVIEISWLS